MAGEKGTQSPLVAAYPCRTDDEGPVDQRRGGALCTSENDVGELGTIEPF